MAGLQSELQQLRSRFEESLSSREISEKRLNEQIREVSLNRHDAQQEVRPTVPNQSADRIINSIVLSLPWKKSLRWPGKQIFCVLGGRFICIGREEQAQKAARGLCEPSLDQLGPLLWRSVYHCTLLTLALLSCC